MTENLDTIKQSKNREGVVILTKNNQFLIGTADFSIVLKQIQMEGRKKMDAGDFLRGYEIKNKLIDYKVF